MDRPHVLLQHDVQGEALATVLAPEGPVLPVLAPGMLAQRGGTVEAEAADEAREGPLPGVSPDVLLHVTLQLVAVAADGAGERLLIVVGFDVGEHVVFGVCYLTAEGAGVCPVVEFGKMSCCVSCYVRFQLLFSNERPSTYITEEHVFLLGERCGHSIQR